MRIHAHAVTKTVAFAIALFSFTLFGLAQEASNAKRNGATVVVDGRVENTYELSNDGDERVVQIYVSRSATSWTQPSQVTARCPAPGEYVYVHLGGDDRTSDRSTPAAGSFVRAYLAIGEQLQWVPAGVDWFEQSDLTVDASDRRSPERRNVSIGISAEAVRIGFSSALKVTRVAPNSPAAAAGIEPGDVLIEANGERLKSEEQLADAFQSATDALTLTVRDSRTGRDVRVEVNVASKPEMKRDGEPLGMETELAFFGGEVAVKITKVAPNSPSDRAGLSPGLLILTINDKRVERPEDISDADQKTSGPIMLKVVDPEDRRERRIEINR